MSSSHIIFVKYLIGEKLVVRHKCREWVSRPVPVVTPHDLKDLAQNYLYSNESLESIICRVYVARLERFVSRFDVPGDLLQK